MKAGADSPVNCEVDNSELQAHSRSPGDSGEAGHRRASVEERTRSRGDCKHADARIVGGRHGPDGGMDDEDTAVAEEGAEGVDQQLRMAIAWEATDWAFLELDGVERGREGSRATDEPRKAACGGRQVRRGRTMAAAHASNQLRLHPPS